MRWTLCLLAIIGSVASLAYGQNRAADLPTSNLLSEPGPTFKIRDSSLKSPLTFIAYGDMRFTDPKNVTATNPAVRKWLVEKLAAEAPAAIFLNGDVPLAGDVVNDYTVYAAESQPWRTSHVRVYPALGNHEFHGPNPQQCLENWWHAFPEFKNRRWYSVQLGARIYAINVDSDASLLPGSDQNRWLTQQLGDLSDSVDFVLISLHHPPVADIQTHIEVDHNPRPNEVALRDLLSRLAPQMHARMLVSAGHIHNYERHTLDDVVYLVSGGGGAKPYFVERTPDDLFQSTLFPNYHYVKFTLEANRLVGAMYRVADPEKTPLTVEEKDQFEIPVKVKNTSMRMAK